MRSKAVVCCCQKSPEDLSGDAWAACVRLRAPLGLALGARLSMAPKSGSGAARGRAKPFRAGQPSGLEVWIRGRRSELLLARCCDWQAKRTLNSCPGGNSGLRNLALWHAESGLLANFHDGRSGRPDGCGSLVGEKEASLLSRAAELDLSLVDQTSISLSITQTGRQEATARKHGQTMEKVGSGQQNADCRRLLGKKRSVTDRGALSPAPTLTAFRVIAWHRPSPRR
jgi:hypothetical protein